MSLDETGWGWRGVQLATILVYIFMFAPILVVVVLSFNASQFGGFPMTGLSLRWYGSSAMRRCCGRSRPPCGSRSSPQVSAPRSG